MRQARVFGAFCSALLGIATSVGAQESKSWDVYGTFYLWGAETKTTISTPARTVESTLKFSDALENLDFAFMGTLEARHQRWSLIADYARTDLSFSTPTSGPAFGGVKADVTTQVLNAYALYQVHGDQNLSFDLGGGLRWFDADAKLTLLPGLLAGGVNQTSDSWTDPLIAARLRVRLSEKWTGAVFLDYGGFSSDSESWQALISAQYAINDRWSLIGGYRYLDISHSSGGNEFGFVQSGPLFGATYKF